MSAARMTRKPRERGGTRAAPWPVRVPWSAAGYGRTRNGSLSTKLAS
jgi:hypothetical protein